MTLGSPRRKPNSLPAQILPLITPKYRYSNQQPSACQFLGKGTTFLFNKTVP
jgi:hypothetical protein